MFFQEDFSSSILEENCKESIRYCKERNLIKKENVIFYSLIWHLSDQKSSLLKI